MSKRIRLAFGLGLVIIMVLAGTVTASALWLTQVTATSTVKVANLDDACVNVTSVVNASFEAPNIQTSYNNASIWQTPDNAVDGWVSNPERIIEIWNQNNFMGIAPPVGNQFVELNASVPGTLSQTIATTPGQTLQWSLLHRGRGGVDTMDVLIGAPGGTQVSQGNISDGTAAWVRYSGAYVVPAGQTSTQIGFRAVSTGSGDQSIGNFLDDVSFGSGPCLQATSTATNFSVPGAAIRSGDQVEYITTVKNIGSSPSFQTVLTNSLPASMTYVAGSMKTGSTITSATTRTDANDTTDTAKYAAGTNTAYVGTSATSTVGGSIAQGTELVFRFLATATSTVSGTVVSYTPTVSFVNMLAPLWGKSITAADAPVTVYSGTDISVAPALTPSIGSAGASSPEWTFSVGNVGNLAATTATVRITVPANVTIVSVTRNTTQGGAVTTNCTAVAGAPTVVDCTFNTGIAVGSTRTISVKGTVAAGAAVGSTYAVTAAVTTAAPADYNAANNNATNTATVADTTAPSAPGAPVASATTSTGTTLTWTASTDNVAVARYYVYRGATQIGIVTAPTLTYTDTGRAALTVYSYTIRAEDAAGNDSDPSEAVSEVTMPAAGTNYTFRNNNTTAGKCISVANTNGAALLTADCAPTSATQQFRFVATTGGFYKIASLNATNLSRIWDIVPNNSNVTDNARPMRVSSVTAAAQNNWLPRVASDGTSIEFFNPNSGRCLDVPNALTTSGQTFQLYDCNNTAAQRFIRSN